MRNTLVLILLALASGSASARWVVVGHTETFAAYADTATMRRTGNMVKMWQLYDYRTAQSSFNDKPYLSARSQYEYDCQEERTRQLQVSSYARKMGKGAAITTVASPSEWRPVPRGSILESMLEMACRKR
jgi:hypothetical protein